MASRRSGSRRRRVALRAVLGLTAMVAVAAGWSAVTALLTAYPLHPRAVPDDPGVWRGAYHVHTTVSRDGHGTVDDVVRAVREAGLDWALVTDHNLVELPPPEYRQGVLVVYAVESSTTEGHLVLLGSRRGLRRPERRGETPLAAARSLGGALVAAHPLNRRRPFRRLDDPSIVGMEVLSLDDAFREAMRQPLRLLRVGWTYPFNGVDAVFHLVHEPEAALRRWDDLLAERHVSGFGALDAHGRPPYDGPVRTLSMHALVGYAATGDAREDAGALTAALVAGRSFLCVEAIAPGAGFRFVATAAGVAHEMGTSVPLKARPRLVVDPGPDVPPGIETRVVCGGEATTLPASATTGLYEYEPTTEGACRAEVWFVRRGRRWPWILSNPIQVR